MMFSDNFVSFRHLIKHVINDLPVLVLMKTAFIFSAFVVSLAFMGDTSDL